MIEAKIVADSVAPSGIRITTFKLVFPRFILSEFNTHRMFSRNASSSRAIPVSKQIEMVKNTPFIPLAFNKNAKGMQGAEALSKEDQSKAEIEWLKARDFAIAQAEVFLQMGIAKQYSNRILEPFTWTTVVCTATDYSNFFALRYHPMAQPEICELAKLMWEAYQASQHRQLGTGQWHLPFVTHDDRQAQWNRMCAKHQDPGQISDQEMKDELIKISVARCARVSYLNHDGVSSTFEQDCQLYDRLLGSAPIHASPAEHQAMAIGDPSVRSGNFTGWIQYRQTLKGQNVTAFEGPDEN